MKITQLERDLAFLTGSETAGRLSGTPGAARAAAYLAAALQDAGFGAAGEDGYFDPVDVPAARLVGPPSLQVAGKTLQYRREYAEVAALSFGGSVSAPLAVAAHGDAFVPGALQGRVVLIPEPPPSFDLAATVKTATELSAGALLVAGGARRPLHKTVYAGRGRLPVMRLREDVAGELAAQNGNSVILELPLSTGTCRCRNVIGLLPASRTDASGAATLALTAHHDHVGDDPGGARFPGAFDNASGVVAVLMAARRLARARRDLPFNLLVAFLTGEESGLWGARRLVANTPLALAAVINLDGVGGEPYLAAMRMGHERPNGWLPLLVADLLAEQGVTVQWVPGRDDSSVFIGAGIPALGLGQQSVNGRFPAIHTPQDTIDALYPQTVAAAAQVLTQIVLQLARTGIGPA